MEVFWRRYLYISMESSKLFDFLGFELSDDTVEINGFIEWRKKLICITIKFILSIKKTPSLKKV